jgi:LytR cell envelope-related transcriptional attenuator
VRRLVTALTLVGLIALVIWSAMWGWRSMFADLPGNPLTAADPTPACQPVHVDAGRKVRAKQVQVSVYNSGDRQGLAGQTLDALVERGFIGGEVGNAPSAVDVRRAQVWSTEPGDPRARLVARQFGRGVKVRVTKRNLGDGVDVVLGDRFQRLSRAPRAVIAKKALDFCVPVVTEAPLD